MEREPVTSTLSPVRENSTTWHLTNAIFLRDSYLSIQPITMQQHSQNLCNQETGSKLTNVPWPTSWHPKTFCTDGIMDDMKGIGLNWKNSESLTARLLKSGIFITSKNYQCYNISTRNKVVTFLGGMLFAGLWNEMSKIQEQWKEKWRPGWWVEH